MKTKINLDTWKRKDHYLFFSQFDEPFHGVTVRIDASKAYAKAKETGRSFFLYYLYRALKAANSIENFRYRIIDKEPYLFDRIQASPTIMRPNETFAFGYMDYNTDEDVFYSKAKAEIKRVQESTDLVVSIEGDNFVHFSALPWVDFSSLSHARSFSFPDSAPKISFGKLMDEGDKKTMAISIHVHHALVDGWHVGLFVEEYQKLMNE